MKKSTISMLTLAMGIMAASCQKEAEPKIKSFEPMTINAVSEGIGKATKTEMIFKYDVAWSANDKIYVKDASGNNDTFSLSGGAGTTKGTFTQEGHASFTGEVQAYYPATMLEGGSPLWPASQTNDQTIPMYCKKTLSGTTDERMDFASLGSVLQIVFNTTKAGVTLKSIEIKDGEKTMSGAFHVDENGMAVIDATDKAGITLDLGTGKALGKGANYFNIAVPAGDYQDLTLVFTATDGAKCTMTKGKVNIASNTVGRLTLTGETFKPDVPEGALPGEFSVSATKTVHFSQGNLWADGSNALHFESNQYSSASSWDASHVSHFTWSDNITSAVSNSNSGSNLFCDENHKVSVDGGDAIYYALSQSEWSYLFNNHVKVWGQCNSVNGYFIAPDGFVGDASTLSSLVSDWTAAEAAGIVFLPAAGNRTGSNVGYVGDYGRYWSSAALVSSLAYGVYFDSSSVSLGSIVSCDLGCSVRLITDSK